MIKLKNIIEHDGIVECDFIPEDAQEYGHLTFSRKTEELEEVRFPEGYERCTPHVAHAKKFFRESRVGELPTSETIMWC